jgi:glycosyltransferase involved in cell wall biosynthesis
LRENGPVVNLIPFHVNRVLQKQLETMRIAYALSFYKSHTMESEVAARTHPCPEYLHFVTHYPSTLVTYDDVERIDGPFAAALRARGMLNWSYFSVIFRGDSKFDSVIAASETIGLPLAVDAYNNGVTVPINIITHGFLYEQFSAMKSIRPFDQVRFLCLSDAVRRMVLERFGVPESRVLNTGYGVDTQFFSPFGAPQDPPLIVSAGLAKRDYHTLLRAVSSINADVSIAANSEWHPVASSVFAGSVPTNVDFSYSHNYISLRQLYARALCVVVPLQPAPCAAGYAVIAEAMAMGRPVIATRTQCPSDLLVEGETGWYVCPGDSDEMRERILYLIANRDLAGQMGKMGRKRVAAHFSNSAYCERLRKVAGV